MILWQSLSPQSDWESRAFCSVSLPPANFSISARGYGSLWISCITSLDVVEWLKLQPAQRLHQEHWNEEMTAWLREVLFLQWPFGPVITQLDTMTTQHKLLPPEHSHFWFVLKLYLGSVFQNRTEVKNDLDVLNPVLLIHINSIKKTLLMCCVMLAEGPL